MKYWLVKTEPDTFSWYDLEKNGFTHWDGVRNYQARNYLSAMSKGDKVFVYHSGKEKSIVGIAEIAREHYPDPTDVTGKWIAVGLVPLKKLPQQIPLWKIKSEVGLATLPLIRQPRLSVMPLTEQEVDLLLQLANICL